MKDRPEDRTCTPVSLIFLLRFLTFTSSSMYPLAVMDSSALVSNDCIQSGNKNINKRVRLNSKSNSDVIISGGDRHSRYITSLAHVNLPPYKSLHGTESGMMFG